MQHQVLEHRELGKSARQLEGAGQTGANDTIGIQSPDLPVLKADFALFGRIKP